jgi:hypothetical protein
MKSREIKAFVHGVHNRFDPEIIKDDAYSDALGWVTKDGSIEISRGREVLGTQGAAGNSIVHAGYKVNGTKVLFQKVGTKVQYYTGSAWADVITGLTADAPITFANYASLAGTFVYIFSTDGIYKIVPANPASYTSLYDSTKNFKGLALIDKGRTIMWGIVKDPTGLYGSWIDAQNSTVYTSVAGEVIADVATGTLAFKAAGATRTCFAVVITDTSSGEVFTDDFNGALVGSLGNTGTINYTTGAFTITGQSGAGTASYQWENSNVKGVTDFTKSAPRVASEGFIFRQDIGGDKIQQVLVIDGIYYSLKANSIYSLNIASDDLDATNEVFRTNVGILSRTSGAATSEGIMLIDTANQDTPTMRIITRNELGDNYDLIEKFQHFKFSDFRYDDAVLYPYGNYVLVSCKTPEADANNRILVCDYLNKTVDIVPFQAKSFTQDGTTLYSGDSLSQSCYKTFNGFDDLGSVLENYVVSKSDNFGESTLLKKQKRLMLRGKISIGQNYDVFAMFDNGSEVLLGNVSSAAGYVDLDNPDTIGGSMVGEDLVGGSSTTLAYPYLVLLKIKTPKYRVRNLKFVANGFGYVSISNQVDWDIWTFEQKIPAKYRQKQNVSVNDGSIIDLSEPNF